MLSLHLKWNLCHIYPAQCQHLKCSRHQNFGRNLNRIYLQLQSSPLPPKNFKSYLAITDLNCYCTLPMQNCLNIPLGAQWLHTCHLASYKELLVRWPKSQPKKVHANCCILLINISEDKSNVKSNSTKTKYFMWIQLQFFDVCTQQYGVLNGHCFLQIRLGNVSLNCPQNPSKLF